jgi:hypothetical protein
MQSHKYELKWFLESAEGVPLDAFIPVFHHWIQAQRLDDVLIDVADYRHVPHGPGVLLIGHDAQYAMDQSAGRLGLLYSRRRETHPSRRAIQRVEARLQSVFWDALTACQQLESEAVFQGKLRFRTDTLQLRINDRLLAPNTKEAYADLRRHLDPFLAQLYPEGQVTIEHRAESSSRLTVAIEITPATDVGTLLARLSTENAVAGVSS